MIGFNLDEAFELVNCPLYPQTLLKECYAQEHRIYHNLDHVIGMLSHVPRNHPEVNIIVDALLFIDVVKSPYPVAQGLDEALSVAEYLLYNTKTLAFETPFGVNGDGSLEYEKKVIGAITATMFHTSDQELLDDVAKMVLDLDLYIYSLPWEEFHELKFKLEQEMNIIYGEQGKERMLLFSKQLLNRNSIYYKHPEWEQQAKRNIESVLFC